MDRWETGRLGYGELRGIQKSEASSELGDTSGCEAIRTKQSTDTEGPACRTLTIVATVTELEIPELTDYKKLPSVLCLRILR